MCDSQRQRSPRRGQWAPLWRGRGLGQWSLLTVTPESHLTPSTRKVSQCKLPQRLQFRCHPGRPGHGPQVSKAGSCFPLRPLPHQAEWERAAARGGSWGDEGPLRGATAVPGAYTGLCPCSRSHQPGWTSLQEGLPTTHRAWEGHWLVGSCHQRPLASPLRDTAVSIERLQRWELPLTPGPWAGHVTSSVPGGLPSIHVPAGPCAGARPGAGAQGGSVAEAGGDGLNEVLPGQEEVAG